MLRRWFSVRRLHSFQLPPQYNPDVKLGKLTLSQSFGAWTRSLQPNRLQQLQDELVELMIPLGKNGHIHRENNKVIIDAEGNHINELKLQIVNGLDLPVKNLVFVHGYGASLGCFARNFQLLNKFKEGDFNYNIHFLDNTTFGLLSNPSIAGPEMKKWFMKKSPKLKLSGGDGTRHNKYYKLVDLYSISRDKMADYRAHYTPILQKLDDFYTGAIEGWRAAKKLNQIDYLIGHSYGGYWSGSYAVRYPDRVKNLILLSPVGVERHVHALTSNALSDEPGIATCTPSLDPTSYHNLTRWPILAKKHIFEWYYVHPFMPRFIKWLGPWGYSKYFEMWYSRLHKINKVVARRGGAEKVFEDDNDLVYGTNKECLLLIEYLYNSISQGSNSDIYIRNLLTPATVCKHPLYDKFDALLKQNGSLPFSFNAVYGEYDYMNAEAGEKLVDRIGEDAKVHKISEGGHNMYLDNPFDIHELIHKIVTVHKA